MQMKTLRTLALAAIVAQIGGSADAGDLAVHDETGFLSQADTIFAVLDRIEGDELTLRLLHTVMSRDAQTIMFVGDMVHATLLPPASGSMRRAACVSEIAGRGGKARIVRRESSFPRSDCLAQVNEYNGAAGLPADRIAIDMVATIRLSGDVVMDGPGAAPPSPPYCRYDADFLKKTWQPFKHTEGRTRSTCEPDGAPRPMDHMACRLGNLQGTQWVFTDHGRVIQASACDPGPADFK
jgi:hypothetical protein